MFNTTQLQYRILCLSNQGHCLRLPAACTAKVLSCGPNNITLQIRYLPQPRLADSSSLNNPHLEVSGGLQSQLRVSIAALKSLPPLSIVLMPPTPHCYSPTIPPFTIFRCRLLSLWQQFTHQGASHRQTHSRSSVDHLQEAAEKQGYHSPMP